MNELIPEFNDSLIIDSADLVGDYLELGIDSVLDNEIAKEIPVLKSLISVGKITRSIRERNYMKNLVIFLNELNSGDIDIKKLKKHQEELKNNAREAEKELGRILIILDQTIDNSKSFILGRLYKSYINQLIDWDLFLEFSEITNRLFVLDIKLLNMIKKRNYDYFKLDREDIFRIERLYSLGLIGYRYPNSSESEYFYGSDLSKLGKKYCDLIFDRRDKIDEIKV